MEAVLRRAVNEIFFRDSWSWPTVATFLATVVGTFLMSNALSRMAFAFAFDGPSQQRRTAPLPAADDESMQDSEHTSTDSSGDDGSDESSDDSGSDTSTSDVDEDDEDISSQGQTFAPIKMRLPSMLDVDPAVTMVREVEHLKSL